MTATLGTTEPTTLAFTDDNARPLLVLRVTDGQLCADYDPERLDDAARALVEMAVRARWSLNPFDSPRMSVRWVDGPTVVEQ